MAGILIAGTTSDAGKSVVTTGLCRALARRGIKVAPFKAQNMSNNSMVCAGPDGDGVEIGRAQWIQAQAARATPEAAMNPVLLKPGSDRRSHVVLMGRPWGEVSSTDWLEGRRALATAAYAAFDDLATRYDVIVAEGAGSPAEINLRAGDYVNLGLARHADLPTVVVGDIDRGGVFAAFFGTVALLSPEDQALMAGFIVNKFRGELTLLEPGLRDLERLTGRQRLRDAAVASRRLAGLRGRARPGRVAAPPAPVCTGWRWCGYPGSATSPTSMRWVSNPTWTSSSSPTRAGSGTLIWWCCPAPAQRSRTWRGCGRVALIVPWWRTPPPGSRCSASAAASRCWAAVIRDPLGVEGAVRGGRRAGAPRRRDDLRGVKGVAAAAGCRAGCSGRGLRDSPWPHHPRSGRRGVPRRRTFGAGFRHHVARCAGGRCAARGVPARDARDPSPREPASRPPANADSTCWVSSSRSTSMWMVF